MSAWGTIFEVAARDAFCPVDGDFAQGGAKKEEVVGKRSRSHPSPRSWMAHLARLGRRTLDIFDIRVDIYFDPHFEAIVRDLGADAEDRRLIFLPTHQSLFDHPVLYKVLQSREFLDAMGWEDPNLV